jgi:hypothetical protein
MRLRICFRQSGKNGRDNAGFAGKYLAVVASRKQKDKTGQQILCREKPYSQSAALNTS